MGDFSERSHDTETLCEDAHAAVSKKKRGSLHEGSVPKTRLLNPAIPEYNNEVIAGIMICGGFVVLHRSTQNGRSIRGKDGDS